VREIEARGGRAVALHADVARPREARALVVGAVRRLGRLDILVNNAALFMRTPVLSTTPAQFDRLLAVNLRAPFFVSQAAARAMGRRGGRIINIADVGAVRAWPGYVPYGVSKAGVVMLTRGLAAALAPHIQVNAVAPGVVLLPENFPRESSRRLAARIPMGRHGRPADVAEAVRFFATCSDYVTGQVLFVDGGMSVL
jgi:pteridine reductase